MEAGLKLIQRVRRWNYFPKRRDNNGGTEDSGRQPPLEVYKAQGEDVRPSAQHAQVLRDVGAEPQNMPEAIKLYEQSAMLNNSKAMMVLGRLYENGIGTKQDI